MKDRQIHQDQGKPSGDEEMVEMNDPAQEQEFYYEEMEGTKQRRGLINSTMNDFSDRMNNRFDRMDSRRKGIVLIGVAITTFIMGLFFLYRFIKVLF